MPDGAWRSISVSLDLAYQRYTQGLATAGAATRQFGKITDGVGTQLDRLASRADRLDEVGGKLTRNVTVPVAAVGLASVKMAADFETTMSRLAGLAGIPAGEIDGLRKSVISLSGETAVAPQELAQALYEAASAGLNAQQAMAAVEVAARGQAAGLGSSIDIVGLIASATAAYGAGAIDAAKATDILTATIREGRADPEELAGTLGRVLPLAAKLGIEFDQVGGTVAFLSVAFGDTNRAVTAVSGLFAKLLSPTKQGRDALEDAGISAERLQEVISENGLLGGLELLRQKGFGENQIALRALFDDMEGYQGALALINADQAKLNEIFDETKGSAGALADAFATASGTDAFQAKQAIVDLQVALVQLGTTLLPVAADLAEIIASVVGAFTDLPGPAQTAILAIVGVGAAAGPVAKSLSLMGKAIEFVNGRANDGTEAVGRFGDAHGPAGSKVAGFLKIVGVAAAGLEAYNLTYSYLENQVKFEGSQENLAKALALVGSTADQVAPTLKNYGLDLVDLLNAVNLVGNFDDANTLQRIGSTLAGQGKDVERARNQLKAYDEVLSDLVSTDPTTAISAYRQLSSALIDSGASAEDVGAAFPRTLDAIDQYRGGVELAGDATGDATDLQGLLAEGLDGTATSASGLTTELDRLVASLDAKTQAADTAFQADLRAISTSDALQAANDKVTETERRNAEAREQASQRVAQARANEAKQAEQSARDIAQADRNLAKAQESAAEAQVEAAERVEEARRGVAGETDEIKTAERQLAQAMESSADRTAALVGLTEDLTDARATAEKQLESLQRREASDELDVEEAQIALIEAQQDQRESDPDETDLDRRKEAVRVARAQAALDEALRRQAENAKELEERQAAGVEGSEVYTSALAALTAGREAEAEAIAAEEAANANLSAKQQEAADELEAALLNQAKVERETSEQVQAAQEAAALAREQAAERAAASAAQVREAERESASVREQGNRDLEQAKRDVIQATLDDIEAQGQALEAAGDTKGSIDGMITKYGELRATLQDGSPYAVALDRRIQALWIMAQLQAAIAGTALPNIPGLGSISGGGGGFAVPGLGGLSRTKSAGGKSAGLGLDKSGSTQQVGALSVQAQQLVIQADGASLVDALTRRKPDLLGGTTKPAYDRPALDAAVAGLVAAGGAVAPVSLYEPIAQFNRDPGAPFGAGGRGSDPEVTALLRKILARPQFVQTGDNVAYGVEDPERAARAVTTIQAQRWSTVVSP